MNKQGKQRSVSMSESLDDKYQKLLSIISSKDEGCVAFSGGVDSSFLCYAAHEALGDKAIAVTVANPMLPQSEIDCAKRVAAACKIRHYIVEERDIEAEVAANPKNRCYFCKKEEFGHIKAEAEKHGVHTVFDGSNMDDLGDYRPGLKAMAELKIVSPLREANMTKADIRELSRRFKLETWDKPAYACLASRIPYGETIDQKKLRRIERAEDFLHAKGFKQVRVRSHGDIARIEVAPEERRKFFDEAFMDEAAKAIKACGFLYAALELEGYKTGSLNRQITNNK
jgi:uncharacterized protein